jgi:hypothetical protein
MFRKLARHDIGCWALTGGVAFEMHADRLGLPAASRALNDLDFVVESFDCIPETLPDDFLIRHVHPLDPPGKIILQMIDPGAALRIDVFRACGLTTSRVVRMDLPLGAVQLVSLEDLIARAARLLLDVADGVPVASKHARDYLRFVGLVDPDAMETAWQDHRKPAHPRSFEEVRRTLPDLIGAHPGLLITPVYLKNAEEQCPRCAPFARFQLADPNAVLALLGYC